MNIKKHISLLLLSMVAGVLMYSCSDDTLYGGAAEPQGGIDTGKEVALSVSLNAPGLGRLRASGGQDNLTDNKIYSLEVLIFKSRGESEEGKLDGYGFVVRTKIPTGKSYVEYEEIDEIKKVKLTAGKRDIYVIANAPDKYFASVTNLQDFLTKCENLSTQIHYPDPGAIAELGDDLPIGGINPVDLRTNLTMCNYMENVEFNNLYEQHYLGYTTNFGRPEGVAFDYGFPLNGTDPFEVERLVARIALKKVEFALPASLPFEVSGGVTYSSGFYSYQIDSIFMMNVKTTSKFAAGSTVNFAEKFGHGNNAGYAFLRTTGFQNTLNLASQYTDYLFEAITTPYYDITTNATPLWFYTFENEDSTYPTYLVIGVRYNFKSSKDNTIKTVKCYYPVEINSPKPGKTVDHDYIKRNYQYQIVAKIKGLGSMYGNNSMPLRSLQVQDEAMEITETVGKNLFPWTGNTYNISTE